jgi:ATP-dependent DNA helicase RecQ
VFGIGAERSRDYWRGVLRQMVAQGVLEVDMGEFATVSLVQDRARPILRGEERVMLRDEAPAPRPRNRGARLEKQAAQIAARGTAPGTTLEEAATLFEALRQWRSGEAKTQSVPPYLIFHDTVLREIAAIRPDSEDELAQIKGVGASKLARYGDDVLELVRQHAT